MQKKATVAQTKHAMNFKKVFKLSMRFFTSENHKNMPMCNCFLSIKQLSIISFQIHFYYKGCVVLRVDIDKRMKFS